MPIPQSRVRLSGKTPYAHEKEAIEFVKQQLPDADPYQVWELAELLDPSTGRVSEIDMLVLGPRALYVVEIKSHPGRIYGDSQDWTWEPPEGGRRYLESPYRATNAKARILKSRIDARMPRTMRTPWLQPLVFLSAPNLVFDVKRENRVGIVTREEVAKALMRHEFHAERELNAPPIDRQTARSVVLALDALGLRKRKNQTHVGPYELREIIDEGPGYQDREAVHRENARMRSRARVYLVPDGTTLERRATLSRAANREAQLLYDVR